MAASESADVQKTLKSEVSISGIGLFTGKKTSLKLCPAPADFGIVFQRIDLPGKPVVPALLSHVKEAVRNTRLAKGEASIFMVEHLLSALFAFGVDNVLIEIDGEEVPAADGSSQEFIDLLEQAGLVSLQAPRSFLRLEQPIFWSEGDVHIVALPSDETRLSYTLHYPQSAWLKSQYFTFSLTRDLYKTQIAPSRTFSLYEEIFPFIEKGIIKGGGLNNALVIQGDKVMNPEGSRFPDEPARHKILDMIGDLALLGQPWLAHIIAIRSGHASHVAFAKTLLKTLQKDKEPTAHFSAGFKD